MVGLKKWMLKFRPHKCNTIGIIRSDVEKINSTILDRHKPMDESVAEHSSKVNIDIRLSFDVNITDKLRKTNYCMMLAT